MQERSISAEPRMRIRLGLALMAGFGSLIFIAVGLVLWLGLWSGAQNTFSLFGQLGGLAIDNLEGTLRRHLDPARATLDHLGRRIEAGEIPLERLDVLEQNLAGAVAGSPQLSSIVFFYPDYRSVQVKREEASVFSRTIDASAQPEVVKAVDQSRTRHGTYWGDIVYISEIKSTLINARRAVFINATYAGLLVASVSVAELSSLLGGSGSADGSTAFVLYKDQWVLAHPKLASGYAAASTAKPLATVADVGDPVLFAYLNPNREGAPRQRRTFVPGVEIVGVDKDTYVPLLSREISGYGDKNWRLGIYLPDDRAELELQRLIWAGAAGFAVLLVAMGFALYLSRKLSQPLKQLALAADRVREFRLGEVPDLPDSRIHELHEANRAFGAMAVGLKWFEAYVPKALVHRLMTSNEDENHSEQREVTLMFTDIVGFTALAEPLAANDTARLLNEHFAILARAIENEGGTIDKFIGDAVMAFWGAPEDVADHADRACRAAMAIRRAIEADNEQRLKAGKVAIGVRLGLHTGPVTIGNIGAPGRINYTVVGDTVNIANRIEASAKALDDTGNVAIALSETTRAALSEQTLDGLSTMRPFGRHSFRGHSGEMDLFCL